MNQLFVNMVVAGIVKRRLVDHDLKPVPLPTLRFLIALFVEAFAFAIFANLFRFPCVLLHLVLKFKPDACDQAGCHANVKSSPSIDFDG
jgi:hypothetical protein